MQLATKPTCRRSSHIWFCRQEQRGMAGPQGVHAPAMYCAASYRGSRAVAHRRNCGFTGGGGRINSWVASTVRHNGRPFVRPAAGPRSRLGNRSSRATSAASPGNMPGAI